MLLCHRTIGVMQFCGAVGIATVEKWALLCEPMDVDAGQWDSGHCNHGKVGAVVVIRDSGCCSTMGY